MSASKSLALFWWLSLLISAAEHYKEGFEPLVSVSLNCLASRETFNLIWFVLMQLSRSSGSDSVQTSSASSMPSISKATLRPDAGTLPDLRRHTTRRIAIFMKIPNYEGWRRKDLVEVLQSRLGSSYAVFSSTISSMEKLMGDLQALLSLKNGEVGRLINLAC